jgi:hypothetical protein
VDRKTDCLHECAYRARIVGQQSIATLTELDTEGWRVARGDPLFPKPVPQNG